MLHVASRGPEPGEHRLIHLLHLVLKKIEHMSCHLLVLIGSNHWMDGEVSLQVINYFILIACIKKTYPYCRERLLK
jgi:hypothetical protein